MKSLNVKNIINLDHWSKSSETSCLKQMCQICYFQHLDSTDSVLMENV